MTFGPSVPINKRGAAACDDDDESGCLRTRTRPPRVSMKASPGRVSRARPLCTRVWPRNGSVSMNVASMSLPCRACCVAVEPGIALGRGGVEDHGCCEVGDVDVAADGSG